MHMHLDCKQFYISCHHGSAQHMQLIETADVTSFLSAHVHAGVIKHFQEPDVWLLSSV